MLFTFFEKVIKLTLSTPLNTPEKLCEQILRRRFTMMKMCVFPMFRSKGSKKCPEGDARRVQTYHCHDYITIGLFNEHGIPYGKGFMKKVRKMMEEKKDNMIILAMHTGGYRVPGLKAGKGGLMGMMVLDFERDIIEGDDVKRMYVDELYEQCLKGTGFENEVMIPVKPIEGTIFRNNPVEWPSEELGNIPTKPKPHEMKHYDEEMLTMMKRLVC